MLNIYYCETRFDKQKKGVKDLIDWPLYVNKLDFISDNKWCEQICNKTKELCEYILYFDELEAGKKEEIRKPISNTFKQQLTWEVPKEVLEEKEEEENRQDWNRFAWWNWKRRPSTRKRKSR